MRIDRPSSTSGADDDEMGLTSPGLRSRWRLARQDRRSSLMARRYGALAVLMSAEGLADVASPACRPGGGHESVRTARAALDVLWRTLHRDAAHRTTHWNPGIAHVRQAEDLQRWGAEASWRDVAALLINSRRVAADEFDAARSGRRTLAARAGAAVPSL